MKKPTVTDLDLRQGMSCSAREGLTVNIYRLMDKFSTNMPIYQKEASYHLVGLNLAISPAIELLVVNKSFISGQASIPQIRPRKSLLVL